MNKESNTLINKQQVIFQTNQIGNSSTTDQKIYVREQKGFYQRIRRSISFVLMSLFILIPFISHQNEQAVIFDLEAQTLKVFEFIFFPHDLLLFVFIFIIAAFALFVVSTKYGRVWCGFTCPQTIWTLMFVWVEHRVEGARSKRIALDKAKWSINKLVKKSLKHTIWLVFSILTSLVFMSYFVPANELYLSFINGQLSNVVFWWVIFFAVCTYTNAGFIREKMCEHMCPYSRFQSVMFNPSTSVVMYDANRGENRGPRKLNKEKPEQLGDCVDCNLCVQVCPVGIDIRNGLQYQCISCGLCIDACDQVMEKFGYKSKLIKFGYEMTHAKSKLSIFAYTMIIISMLVSLGLWLGARDSFEVSVIKDRNVLYRTLYSGETENSFTLKLLNKTNQKAIFNIATNLGEQFTIIGATDVSLKPKEHKEVTITIRAPSSYHQVFRSFKFNISNDSEAVSYESTFHGQS
ncbi:cytochrome c oxidase accessory protein CcoG [Thalassotalea crassostreae]|uniref:cytochrome c oxidase accessory protein CcoG n=1 Tax=Thalassotalea crassostreae TaxID=1763536 RepID=UPI0009EE93E0|nr:cytochrome c oxidase accessory protein CcoG [Thalassotalea crassostreae]